MIPKPYRGAENYNTYLPGFLLIFPNKNIMKCLNCGHAIHPNTSKCHFCNIPVKTYGIIRDNAPLDESPVKDAGPKCPNCNGRQDYPFAKNCQHCNFPIQDKETIQPAHSENNHNQGFVWNRMAKERFSVNSAAPLQLSYENLLITS
jgi:hypothetical protein